MKNNIVSVLLVILLGLFLGVVLLRGIGAAMHVAIAPVSAHLNQIESRQREILK